VPRNNIVEGHAFNRFSIYGSRGSLVESVNLFLGPDYIWNYQDFCTDTPIEGGESVNVNVHMRGGWIVNLRGARQFFRFDPKQYEDYEVQRPDGSVETYVPPRILNGSFSGTFAVYTPTYRKFNGSLEVQRNNGAIFEEAADGNETRVTAGLSIRPTESIRIETTGIISHITRVRDGSEFARTVIPRFKVEYQPRRSLFFRVVAEYRSQRQSALEDARTGDRLIIGGVPGTPEKFNALRLDLLASYQPTPGTVAFVGYGSSLETESTFGLTDLRRANDGFFVKLAYLFRH
jgi:hypothetical protein